MNTSMKWVDEVRGTDSIREVARRSGINQATLNRQINLDVLSFESVRDISRAYASPVLAGLLRTGHLRPSDVGTSAIERALNSATDEQLVVEVAHRLGVAEFGGIFDKPVTEAITEATIHQFPSRDVPALDEDEGTDAVARPAETEPTDEQ